MPAIVSEHGEVPLHLFISFKGPGARPWKAKHGRATCRETCTCGPDRGPRYTVPICVGPRNLSEIVMAQRQIWFGIPLFPVLVMFFISRPAETNRAPPDPPEAEAESVAGYNAEYARDAILRSSLLAEANVPGSGGLILTETRAYFFIGVAHSFIWVRYSYGESVTGVLLLGYYA